MGVSTQSPGHHVKVGRGNGALCARLLAGAGLANRGDARAVVMFHVKHSQDLAQESKVWSIRNATHSAPIETISGIRSMVKVGYCQRCRASDACREGNSI